MKDYLKVIKKVYLSIEPSDLLQKKGWKKIKKKISEDKGKHFKRSLVFGQSTLH